MPTGRMIGKAVQQTVCASLYKQALGAFWTRIRKATNTTAESTCEMRYVGRP
jgi:hypothetical protein